MTEKYGNDFNSLISKKTKSWGVTGSFLALEEKEFDQKTKQ
jgi:hypothetical protein